MYCRASAAAVSSRAQTILSWPVIHIPIGRRRVVALMRSCQSGKVGGAFTSSATQHGGQETTLFSIITNLLHFGMVVVPDDARLWSTVRRDVGPGRRQGYVAGHSSGRGRLSCRPSEPIGGPQDPVRAAAGSPMRSTMAAPIGACAGSAWCYQSCTSSSVSGRPATSQASRPPQYQ
jgi:hypothetical protein